MRHVLFGLSVAVLLPSGLRAQAPVAPPDRKVDVNAMYEDIEIMRRLLTKELTSHRGGAANFLNAMLGAEGPQHADAVARGLGWLKSHQGTTETQYLSRLAVLGYLNASDADESAYHRYLGGGRYGYVAATPFEGTYLKGHGVAYTATINPAEAVALNTPQKSLALLVGCGKCHDTFAVKHFVEPPADPAPKPLSDWERMRQQLRGTKDEPKPAVARVRVQDICSPGNLTEIYLKLLAENGHNFKQLAATENLTVAITVHGRAPDGKGEPAASAKHSVVKEAEELLALAQLHAKQGKNDDAAANFAAALKKLSESPLSFPADAPMADVHRQTDAAKALLRNIYTKYAQLLLDMGKLAEARQVLGKAETAQVTVSAAKGASPATAAAHGPMKLVISVSKKALDDVHAGKIDREQYKKLADVQAINFPPADKKK